jgi:hypothetical protein
MRESHGGGSLAALMVVWKLGLILKSETILGLPRFMDGASA